LIRGLVDKVLSFDKNGKVFYSIKMADGTLYGTGVKKPAVSNGDHITFEATQNGKYWNADANTIQIVPQPAAQTADATPARSQSRNDDGREKYWQDKAKNDITNQRVISRQACNNTAVQLVTAMLAKDLVALPAKKGDAATAVEAYVFELSEKFYQQAHTVMVTDPREEGTATTEGGGTDDIPW
jgi:hypothetical protein